MASNFIWHAMTEVRLLHLHSLERMSVTMTRMCSKYRINVCTASCSLIRYISQKLFDFLIEDGIQLVTGQRVNMKNKLMPFYDRMMLRKRYIIETINDLLKIRRKWYTRATGLLRILSWISYRHWEHTVSLTISRRLLSDIPLKTQNSWAFSNNAHLLWYFLS